MATSNFQTSLETAAGAKVTSGTVELLPYGNSYPTGALALTHQGDGVWSRSAVPDGEYSLYYNGTLVSKYQRFWIGEQRLSDEADEVPDLVSKKHVQNSDTILDEGNSNEVTAATLKSVSDHFDSADSYKLKGSGIKIDDSTIESSSDTLQLKDLGVTNSKIGDREIETNKTKFVYHGKNLFNKLEAVEDKYVNDATGAELSLAEFLVTPYIEIESSTQYAETRPSPAYGNYWHFYDENKTWISRTARSGNTFTTPANAAYLRTNLALSSANWDTQKNGYQLEKGSSKTDYEAFAYSIKNKAGTIGLVLDDNSVTPTKTNFIQSTKNLFDKSSALENTLINDATGSASSSTGFLATPFIEIESSTQYAEIQPSPAYGNYWHFYDENKTWISRTARSGNTFTTPATAKYFRRNLAYLAENIESAKNSYQLEKGSSPSSYEDFGYHIEDDNSKGLFLLDQSIRPSKLREQTKTVVSTTNPIPDYIGQMGRDASGNVYVAIALSGTVWELVLKINEGIELTSDGKLKAYLSDKTQVTNTMMEANKLHLRTNLVTGVNKNAMPTSFNSLTNMSITAQANNAGLIDENVLPYKLQLSANASSGTTFFRNSSVYQAGMTKVIYGVWRNKTQLQAMIDAMSDTDYIHFYGYTTTQGYKQLNLYKADLQTMMNKTKFSKVTTQTSGYTFTMTFKVLAHLDDWVYTTLEFTNFGGATPTDFFVYEIYTFCISAFYSNPQTLFNPVILRNTESINPFIAYPEGTLLTSNVANRVLDTPIKDKIRVIKRENNIYVRSYFNESQDVVIKYKVSTDGNLNINMVTTYLIANTTSDTPTNYEAGTVIHTPGDDITPWNTSNTAYIGGNHGFNTAKVTVASHDKVNADIGSIWSDGTNQWYLADIIDATHLQFSFKTSGVEGTWTATHVISGSTLTHVSGATNTSAVNFSAQELLQETPITKNRVKKYLVDGKYPIRENIINFCEYFDIVDEYEIVDPSTYTPSYPVDWTSGSSWVRNKIIYRFQNYGNVLVDYTAEILREVDLGYMGFTQMAKLNQGSYDKVFAYMPRVLTNNGYDLKSIIDMTSNPTVSLLYDDTYLEDATNPPDRFLEFLGDTDGTKRVGFAHGYNTSFDLGKASERAANNTTKWNIYTSGKSYPRCIDSALGQLAAGNIYHVVAYRQYFDPQLYSGLTAVYFYKLGNDYYLYLDAHQNLSNNKIDLPSFLKGKKITVLDKDSNFTLKTDEIVSSDGVIISVTGGYGYAVIKLS